MPVFAPLDQRWQFAAGNRKNREANQRTWRWPAANPGCLAYSFSDNGGIIVFDANGLSSNSVAGCVLIVRKKGD